MKVQLSMKSVTPLLMHNVQMANPLNPTVRQMKEITSKRKKTDKDFEEIAKLEFAGSLYFDAELGPVLPGENIARAIGDGAKLTRQGMAVKRALIVEDLAVPLIYQGPREIELMWAAGGFVDMQMVRVSTAKVMRTRPIFRHWACEAVLLVDENQLSLSSLRAIVNDAGSKCGIGDYRPRYGRFEAEVVEL